MTQLLYVDASVRRHDSRTLELADALLAERQRLGDVSVKRVVLAESHLTPLVEATLTERTLAAERKDFGAAIFAMARMLTDADEVLIAAPCYDLSFPSLLKVWIEQIMIPGLTFEYGEDGMPHGLLHVKRAWYVSTTGGPRQPFDFGFEYVKTLFAGYFGVSDFRQLSADRLDIVGNNPAAILAEAKSRIAAEMV